MPPSPPRFSGAALRALALAVRTPVGALAARTMFRRDLGIVQINNKKVKDGEKSFKDAFAADPTVTIGKDFLSNAEVAKAWNAAKAAAPAATPTVTAPTTAPTPTATAKPPTSTAEGNIEVKNRKSGERRTVALADAVAELG